MATDGECKRFVLSRTNDASKSQKVVHHGGREDRKQYVLRVRSVGSSKLQKPE